MCSIDNYNDFIILVDSGTTYGSLKDSPVAKNTFIVSFPNEALNVSLALRSNVCNDFLRCLGHYLNIRIVSISILSTISGD